MCSLHRISTINSLLSKGSIFINMLTLIYLIHSHLFHPSTSSSSTFLISFVHILLLNSFMHTHFNSYSSLSFTFIFFTCTHLLDLLKLFIYFITLFEMGIEHVNQGSIQIKLILKINFIKSAQVKVILFIFNIYFP